MAGGRPKGSTTRNGEFLLKRLKDVLGEDFDPFVKMAQKASDDNDPDQIQALKEICQYIKPKLKSIDMVIDADVDMTVTAIERTIVETKDTDS